MLTNSYVKLTSKPNHYYDEGTEVFNYGGERYNLTEWNECLERGICGTRGLRNGEYDGEWSLCEEFDVEHNAEYKTINY